MSESSARRIVQEFRADNFGRTLAKALPVGTSSECKGKYFAVNSIGGSK